MQRNDPGATVLVAVNHRKKRQRRPKGGATAVTKAQVREMIRGEVELKYGTYDTTNFAVPLAGSFTKLTPMAQGVGKSARVGDEVHLRSLTFKYTITVGAVGLVSVADQYNAVRVVVFKYLEDDGLASPNNNILSAASANNTLNPINPDYRDQYKVLYDHTHVVFNAPIWNGSAVSWQHGVGGTYATEVPIKVPLQGKINFQQGAVTGVGHIYMACWSDSAFTPNPTLEFVSVVEYTDA